MKTLAEMQAMVRENCSAAMTLGELRTAHLELRIEALSTCEAVQAIIFASLAAWDAVVKEALPGLQAEYEALKALKQGHNNEWEYECAVNDQRSDAGYSALPHKYISPTGLARLEYLRGILEEEAP